MYKHVKVLSLLWLFATVSVPIKTFSKPLKNVLVKMNRPNRPTYGQW